MWRALLMTMLPVQALALSCMPYGVTDAYLDAAESTETYLVVLGQLTFDEARLPTVDFNNQDATPPLTRIKGSISGVQLGRKGQRAAFTQDIDLHVQCFGPWCSQPSRGQALAFLEKTPEGYVLATDPCGGFLFNKPTREQIQAVQQCLDGGTCEESDFPE